MREIHNDDETPQDATLEAQTEGDFSSSQYPDGIDEYNIPPDPGSTYLSQNPNYPGNHATMHQAENDSIAMIEKSALVDNSATSHDHSDPWNVDYSQSRYVTEPTLKKGRQLQIQNTHIAADNPQPLTAEEASSADANPNSWHHTVVTSQLDNGAGNTDYQAISWQLWNSLGLSKLADDYFSTSLPRVLNNLQNWVTTFQDNIAQLQNQITDLQGGVPNLGAEFNAYYNQRCNQFLGEYPAGAILFNPTSNINQIPSGGITDNYAQVDLFSRWAILHLHSFYSAHQGIDSQVMIFEQQKQSDGSWWAPNYEIFYPMAVLEQNPGSNQVNWSRDISWKPDGNIYISSLGNPEEVDMVIQTIAKMPYNIEMLHYNADGDVIEATNQPPFSVNNGGN